MGSADEASVKLAVLAVHLFALVCVEFHPQIRGRGWGGLETSMFLQTLRVGASPLMRLRFEWQQHGFLMQDHVVVLG